MVLRAAGVTLRRSVVVQSVVDEEAGGAGALDCIRRGYTATAAVVGEPTSLRICPGSRGSLTVALRVAGRKAHPGEGWRGVNAVHAAWRYVEALERLRDELDRTRMHPLWAALPVGHVWNLMAIDSGPAGRAVPDRCEVRYGIGLIGTERLADLQEIVTAAIARVTAADPWLAEHPPDLEWSPWPLEPAVTDPAHPAVASMVAAGAALGERPVVQALSAVSDARHLTNTGGIPTINFGPGGLHRCHGPEEALPVEELRRAVTWLALFIARYCGVARGPAAP
jgi:acetylornithine deacetylase